MAANTHAANRNLDRWRDLVLDLAVPLLFAVMTAGFFALAVR